MELWGQGEEKLFVQVLFGKVEPAICCLSAGPQMKNIRGAEQFSQFKMNRGMETMMEDGERTATESR